MTGLSVLHDEKICHRDIKSGNIFISQDHKMETIYKLGDFNVSKIAKNNINGKWGESKFKYFFPSLLRNKKINYL